MAPCIPILTSLCNFLQPLSGDASSNFLVPLQDISTLSFNLLLLALLKLPLWIQVLAPSLIDLLSLLAHSNSLQLLLQLPQQLFLLLVITISFSLLLCFLGCF
uniref:Uncharacterized protein n=1 Tax=Panagrolaimus sp. ES5 TaxID=591445 RepID=A0AC34FQ29_9BILA